MKLSIRFTAGVSYIGYEKKRLTVYRLFRV